MKTETKKYSRLNFLIARTFGPPSLLTATLLSISATIIAMNVITSVDIIERVLRSNNGVAVAFAITLGFIFTGLIYLRNIRKFNEALEIAKIKANDIAETLIIEAKAKAETLEIEAEEAQRIAKKAQAKKERLERTRRNLLAKLDANLVKEATEAAKIKFEKEETEIKEQIKKEILKELRSNA